MTWGMVHSLTCSKTLPATRPRMGSRWGVNMFRKMIETVDVQRFFERPGEHHVRFIELLIKGLPADRPWPGTSIGRCQNCRFLVDVVHNHRSGIDVDKLDYLARDSIAIFGGTDFSVERILSAIQVVVHEGEWVLAFEENVAFNVAEMYALRANLHRRVYQHRAVMVAEGLIRNLIRVVDDVSNGAIRKCLRDLDAFLELGGDSGVFNLATRLRNHARVAQAMDALLQRPWVSRVQLTACIRTHPSCSSCGACTCIEDAYCTKCGQSTVSRIAVSFRTFSVSPECTIIEDEAGTNCAPASAVTTCECTSSTSI